MQISANIDGGQLNACKPTSTYVIVLVVWMNNVA
jgi:hypothetical protein